MSASQHSILPWRAEKEDTDSGLNCDWLVQAVCGDAWDNIAACGGSAYEDNWKYTDELRQANAEFIVRAVNSHEMMVKALENLLECYVSLVNSGDAGNWDPETETEVGAARIALFHARGE